MIVATSCNGDNANNRNAENEKAEIDKETDDSTNEELHSIFNIKVDIQNPDDRHEKYLVFLLPTGSKSIEKGYKGATQGGYMGPFTTDENDEISIDIRDKWDYEWLIDSEKNTQPGSFEVFITTEEDVLILNPLNDETIIQVEEVDEFSYGVKEKSYTIPIVDKYPDGVVSLPFPEATFVIKLQFAEGVVPKSSYLVAISQAGHTEGSILNGRLDRKFQYWDTPFFAEDQLDNWNGTIIIKDDNKRISYAEYPIEITFTDGKCDQGDVIVITITE